MGKCKQVQSDLMSSMHTNSGVQLEKNVALPSSPDPEPASVKHKKKIIRSMSSPKSLHHISESNKDPNL